MKELLLIPILCFFNVLVSQQNNEKLNKIFNPEQEAILTTKQLSLRLDLTNMQEKKIINFLKLHLIEGEKIRQKRKKPKPKNGVCIEKFVVYSKKQIGRAHV